MRRRPPPPLRAWQQMPLLDLPMPRRIHLKNRLLQWKGILLCHLRFLAREMVLGPETVCLGLQLQRKNNIGRSKQCSNDAC